MKKFLLFAAISSVCFLSKISYAQTPDWLWAKSAGGTNYDYAYSVAVDDSGNTYVAGYFYNSTITFDSTTLTNAGGGDIFLAKYDASGNVQWAKSAGGTNYDCAYSVAVDDSGNTYIVGGFSSPTLSFGSDTLTNAGYSDIFLAKYDANGNVLWAKSAGGTNYDCAYSVAVDDSGNTYLAGYFQSPTIIFGSDTLTNVGSWDIFLAKYDANGNVLWAKSAGGTNSDCAYSVAVDALGNIYVAGYFCSPTITFGSTTFTNAGPAGYSDIFLAKYDTSGNVQWAKSAGGTNYDCAYSVAVDSSGNIFVTGGFESPTLSFGSTILTNADNTGNTDDIFLAKYAPNGNVLWAKSAGGVDYDYATSVAVDASGNTYMAGSFCSPTLSFGSTTLTNASAGFWDIFLTKYDANGNVLWAKSTGGADEDDAYSVAVDASGNTYMAGAFDGFFITFGSTTLTNVGGYDIFIAKLPFAVTTSQTNVSCNGGNNGTATANAAGGGTSLYTYLWNTAPAQTTQTATGLAAGSYIVTVTDANGTPSTASVTITQPSALNISTSGNTIICKGSDTTICVFAAGGVSPYQYLWSNSSTTSCQTVNPVNTTNYSVTVTDACTATSSILTVTVDSASQPTITQNGNILFSTAASSYQWNLNGNPINGATGQMYAPLVSGVYSVTVANANGCSATSDTISVVVTGLSDLSDNKNIYIYPNPATDNLTIEAPQKSTIEILDIQGQLIKTFAINGNKTSINVSAFPSGMYFVKAKTEKGVAVKKFVKE
ncbi:MAG: SBBP repeat-containing protein [Bacteroidales bacterium]